MEIPFGKIAIYVLTFVGYAYSGYGSGILSNLRDAVISAENVFGDAVKNIINVANNLNGLNDVFHMAVEEHCIFKCPNVNVTPKPDRNHRASSNGCGSLGLKIDNQYLPVGDMTKCCDAHDVCYDSCGRDKEVCDMDFKRCLYKLCDGNQKRLGETGVVACKGAAKMLFTGTLTLGCKSYLDAQKNACYCGPTETSKKKGKYRTTGADEL
ncbi:PREDICTED: group XIIA secretory phospholipase A2 [Nicrophorus vespilloides]|uniref:Group XIIA secretory phospholipase A2 n=1 Tax=Nicrophorus vespilloides TaxID=110193 RepID=A0ABM1NFI5_NICVS|nr:PREDICTED: group XIIA secretory phospholipase A2 [Nicrophorus vespilloides]